MVYVAVSTNAQSVNKLKERTVKQTEMHEEGSYRGITEMYHDWSWLQYIN